MSTEGGGKHPEIVSLDNFRQKVRPKQAGPEHVDWPEPEALEYEFTEYSTYTSVRKMLSLLEQGTVPSKLVIATRDVSHSPSNVTTSRNNRGLYYAVDRNLDELEELTLDLEDIDTETEELLRAPMARFYTATLIANDSLRRSQRVNAVNAKRILEKPTIGSRAVNLEDDERFLDVTTWRAAAGMGMLAVSARRPGVGDAMHGYLQDVLVNRLHYDRGVAEFAHILGREPQGNPALNDRLLGVCNPLSRFALRGALLPRP